MLETILEIIKNLPKLSLCIQRRAIKNQLFYATSYDARIFLFYD